MKVKPGDCVGTKYNYKPVKKLRDKCDGGVARSGGGRGVHRRGYEPV